MTATPPAKADLPALKAEIHDVEESINAATTREYALESAIKAAELCMRALKLADDKQEKARLSAKCKALLNRAEQIKLQPSWTGRPSAEPVGQNLSTHDRIGSPASRAVIGKRLVEPRSTRIQSRAEQIIVLKASKLNDSTFQPWQDPPGLEAFEDDGNGAYQDTAELELSEQQAELLAGWERPAQALPPPAWPAKADEKREPTMRIDRTVDLVQDAATDCSVVASLCSATARGERGHARLLANIMYPYDHDENQPAISANGRYVMRMNFNGGYRRVTIDDRLPVSKSRHLLHVIDRNNRTLLWPALLEKAYLKIRGGYAFPGSNPSTDLWVIIGWIPEHVFMQDDGLNANALWKRLLKAHEFGDVLVNLGTGHMSRKVERSIGLASQHAYAVLDLKEEDDQCLLLVKNPWSEGESWRGYSGGPDDTLQAKPDGSATSGPPGSEQAHSPTANSSFPRPDQQMTPGTFWIDFNKVMQHFESIYLNWNPGLFKFRQDIHFSWDLSTASRRGSPGCYVDHPQLAVGVKTDGVLWLLLNRHFKNGPAQSEDEASPAKAAGIDLEGHISLSVHASNGKKIYTCDGALERGPFVDSPQTLVRLEIKANTTYTVAVAEQELLSTVHTFTLSAFAQSPITLEEAPSRYRFSQTASSAWTAATSGGNGASPIYSRNPQTSVEVDRSTPLMLLLETLAPNLNVHIKLVYSLGGKRITRPLKRREILGDSGDYRKQSCIAELDNVEPGTYNVIASTFEPNQYAPFTLRVDSDAPIKMRTLPSENAGRLPVTLKAARFPTSASKIACRLQPRKTCNISVQASLAQTPQQHASGHRRPDESPSPIRLAIEHGTRYDRRQIAQSNGGEFADVLATVRTAEVDLWPDMLKGGELWLVAERLVGGSGASDEQYALEAWLEGVARPEDAVAFGEWVVWEDD